MSYEAILTFESILNRKKLNIPSELIEIGIVWEFLQGS